MSVAASDPHLLKQPEETKDTLSQNEKESSLIFVTVHCEVVMNHGAKMGL